MSELVIVLFLLIPIFVVISILNRSQKKHRRKEQEELAGYINPVIKEAGLAPTYQKRLAQQYIAIDEAKRTLLLVNWKETGFAHELHRLDDIKTLSVQTIRQNVLAEAKAKPEIVTSEIGVEFTLQKTEEKRFLTVYSHLKHNISQIADFTTEATQLCDKLKKLKAAKPLNV